MVYSGRISYINVKLHPPVYDYEVSSKLKYNIKSTYIHIYIN